MANFSVVLISHNQEWNIERLIRSVLHETSHLPACEVVLVDSASSDRTVEIARQYPIRVLRLHTNQPLTSHAGRYVGFRQTTGDLVLFLDGDMELIQGWLPRALRLMQERADVAVIDGARIDVPMATKSHDEVAHIKPTPNVEDWDSTNETTKVGGAALYRRRVLDQVGPFNPWLCSEGEPELCLRIRHAGYKVVQFGHPVVYHYSDPPRHWGTVIGRRKRRLYVGPGQIMRYHLGGELFWPYIRWRAYGLVGLAMAMAGLAALTGSLALRQPIWIILWGLSLVVVITGDLIRRRKPSKTFSALLERAFQAEGTVKGFIMKVRNPDDYPAAFDEVKSASNLDLHREVTPPARR